MLTEEQRIARKSGLGGSDIAAICGMNPYKTAFDVWVEKTTETPAKEDANMNMLIGNALEELIADTYLKHRNEGSIEFAEPHVLGFEIDTFVHLKHPYLRANVDRLLSDGGVLEVKTALSFGSQKQWREGIPDYHRYQIAYYAWVLDAPYVDVAVLCLGEKRPRYYRYERNAEFESLIINAAHDFWNNYVSTKVHPLGMKPLDIDSTETIVVRESNEYINSLIDELVNIKAYKDRLVSHEEQIRALIIDYIGDYQNLAHDGKVIATYKPQIRSTFDSRRFKEDQPDTYKSYIKTSETRVLRFMTDKKEDI